MAIRFGNALFEPLWRREWIQDVQITIAEELGVETRGDSTTASALRDMVQNHLLQLLCMVTMEPPASLSEDAIRDEKIKILKAPADHAAGGGGEDGARAVPGRGRRRPARAGLPGRARHRAGQPHRDLRRHQGRNRQLALGRRAVLPAHRQAHAGARGRDRDPLPRRAPCDLPAPAGPVAAEPAGDPAAAGGEHPAVLPRQAARRYRDADPDLARPRPRQLLLRAAPAPTSACCWTSSAAAWDCSCGATSRCRPGAGSS